MYRYGQLAEPASAYYRYKSIGYRWIPDRVTIRDTIHALDPLALLAAAVPRSTIEQVVTGTDLRAAVPHCPMLGRASGNDAGASLTTPAVLSRPLFHPPWDMGVGN